MSPENYVSHRKAKSEKAKNAIKGTFAEDELQEADTTYGDVLDKHGYQHHESNDESTTYKHPNGSHVTIHRVTPTSGSSWEHKGKNKKLIGNTGQGPKSLDSHLKGVARAQRSSSARKDREDTMRSLGLNKVKGAVSGKTYWESEETPKSEAPKSETSKPPKKKRRQSFANMYHHAMLDMGLKAYRGMDGKLRYESAEPETEMVEELNESVGHEGKGHPDIIKHGYKKKTNRPNGIDDSSGVTWYLHPKGGNILVGPVPPAISVGRTKAKVDTKNHSGPELE